MGAKGVPSGSDFYEYHCGVCGKTICTANPQDWVYKRTENGKGSKLTYCCSWSCFRKLPEKHGVGNLASVRPSRKEEILELLRAGKDRREIADALGISRDRVRYWEKKFAGQEARQRTGKEGQENEQVHD